MRLITQFSRRHRLPIRRTTLLLVLIVPAALATTGTAHATSYSLRCWGILPNPFVAGCYNAAPPVRDYDFWAEGNWNDRRLKWTSGNIRDSRASYNLYANYDIYEVTDTIPANNHVAHYFSRSHPRFFNNGDVLVAVRVRNLGNAGMDLYGQVSL